MQNVDFKKALSAPEFCRDELERLNRLELLGPNQGDPEPARFQRLVSKPTALFSCGIIFPIGFTGDIAEVTEDQAKDIDVEVLDDEEDLSEQGLDKKGSQIKEQKKETFYSRDDGEVPDDILDVEQKNQSSFGLSFRVPESTKLKLDIYFGYYFSETVEKDGQKTEFFQRKEFLQSDIELDLTSSGQPEPIQLQHDGVQVRCLKKVGFDGILQVSVWLVNAAKSDLPASSIYKACIFQPRLGISSEVAFLPIENANDLGRDADTKSNALLYRRKKIFAKGHGCATDWKLDEKNNCNLISSDFFPSFDVMPILPLEKGERFSGVDFTFYSSSQLDKGLSNKEADANILKNLSNFCNSYAGWLDQKKELKSELPEHFQRVAEENLDGCNEALVRMRASINMLSQNETALRAFRLANHAMLLQQLRGGIERKKNEDFIPPDENDPETLEKRKWRPFQLAFVLLTISGVPLGEFKLAERDLVDLIWFPTGGGKTEAYLGVAAFSICYSRILDPSFCGTEVLMRYTLRLLTSQQFQRATTLILALEFMRQKGAFEDERITGSEAPFSAGLWVGGDLTPNQLKYARSDYKDLTKNGKNRFAVLQCPWCKTSLEKDNYAGYKWRDGEFSFTCPEKLCDYFKKKLPIFVIDEQLYKNPPTLLLSTVDKFALLPWYDGPAAFLGRNSGKPPSLVIQDELHLISGPLGSVVGHYENLIFGVMEKYGASPKIVASTATIRRAQEQSEGLYGRDVRAFPPQALDYDDSFFAVEASLPGTPEDGKPKAQGRRYVGVFTGALKSHITAQRNLMAGVFQFPKALAENLLPAKTPENQKDGRDGRRLPDDLGTSSDALDPYGTVVWYFNSIRELGYASSLLEQDISQHTKNIRIRYDIPYPLERRDTNATEMTSRAKENEIFEILEALERKWTPNRNFDAIDVLLATNMISVGVDIDRLGLMVITGQPKNTSEYIQSSSRVGRQKPGLVFALYNQNRSRDRSHFENFKGYHQALYRFVEPTSVTPYSYKCRERSLPGLIVGIARHIVGMPNPRSIDSYKDKIINYLDEYKKRVDNADLGDDELDMLDAQIEKIFEVWTQQERYNDDLEWGTIIPTGDAPKLLSVLGQNHDADAYEKIELMTSMRNVDASSTVRVIRDGI